MLEKTDFHRATGPAAPVTDQYTLLRMWSKPRMENQRKNTLCILEIYIYFFCGFVNVATITW